MSDARRGKWEKAKAMGRRRFVAVYGLVVPLLFAALCFALVASLLIRPLYRADPSGVVVPLVSLAAALAVGVAAAWYAVRAAWERSERESAERTPRPSGGARPPTEYNS